MTSSAGTLRLRTLASAKINLGLFVGRRRADGRHELVTVMQSISLADELTLELTRAGGEQVICPGLPELVGARNLAARALAEFRAHTGWRPDGLRLTIVKRVPVAAGMAGGSADAAAALRLAAHASGYRDDALVQRLAVGLGADVPAQVVPGRWLARGAGELLQPLPAPAQPFGVLVLPLAASLSTAAVYAQADMLGMGRADAELGAYAQRLQDALAGGVPLPPRELLRNDLQRAAISLCPAIETSLDEARAAGADVALVSGSGPTVLGLFGGEQGMRRAGDAAKRLGGRVPAPIASAPVGAEAASVVAVRNNDPPIPQQ